MYSNLTNGELSQSGDSLNSTPHASPSAIASEPTLQHGQSMDSVAGAGEDEVGGLSFCACVRICLSAYDCMSVCLSVCVHMIVSVRMTVSSVCAHVCVSVYLPVCVRMTVFMPLSVCVRVSVCLSFCLSLHILQYYAIHCNNADATFCWSDSTFEKLGNLQLDSIQCHEVEHDVPYTHVARACSFLREISYLFDSTDVDKTLLLRFVFTLVCSIDKWPYKCSVFNTHNQEIYMWN